MGETDKWTDEDWLRELVAGLPIQSPCEILRVISQEGYTASDARWDLDEGAWIVRAYHRNREVAARFKAVLPEPGAPATIAVGSDRYPATVSRVSKSGITIWVREDRCRAVPGERYLYVPNPDAPEQAFRWSRRRRCFGARMHQRLILGVRRRFIDPHF